LIQIIFEKCDSTVDGNTCRSDAELREWLKGKYVYLVSNKEEIKRNTYEADPIEHHTEFIWLSVNIDAPEIHPIRISENILELDDVVIGIKTYEV
jgi:hypothetical protein